MPFHPCPTGCSFYNSPSDKHKCPSPAPMDRLCPPCENMPIGMLHSHSFLKDHESPQQLPTLILQLSCTRPRWCALKKCKDFSFRIWEENELSITASESGLEPSEVSDLAGTALPSVTFQYFFFSLRVTLGWQLCLPRQLRTSGLCGLPVSLIAQTLCKVKEDMEQVLMDWVNKIWFSKLMLIASAPPWRIPLRRYLLSQGQGMIWHPCPDLWNIHPWSLDWARRNSVGFHPQWWIL